MGSSSSSHDCSPSGYWDEVTTAGQLGAAIGSSVGAVGGAALGAFAGGLATGATAGAAAPLILSTASVGSALGAVGGALNFGAIGVGIGLGHHLYDYL